MQDNPGFDDGEHNGSVSTGFRNYRDTLAVKSPLRTSENTVDTNSLVSEPGSILPELSITEERAIRLSGCNFLPIQTPPEVVITPASDPVKAKDKIERPYANIGDWKPSKDIEQLIDEYSDSQKSNNWDDNGINLTPERKYDPVPIIPSTSRNSTPVSVASTGDRWIRNNDHQQNIQFSPPNVQTYINQQNGHAKTSAIGKSTREMVTIMDKSIGPDDVEIRPANQDETDSSLKRKKTVEDEKGSNWLVPKVIMFILAVMIILAAIVALIVRFKDNDVGEIGKIIPNPILNAECPDVAVKLGQEVNFTCRFDLTHAYRKVLTDFSNYKIEPVGRIISEEFFTFKKTHVKDSKSLNITFESNDWTARCSTEGQYAIHLENENDSLLHTANVTIRIKSSTLNTTLEQHLETCPKSEPYDVKTYFEATCFISGDCNSYQPSIVRRSALGVESLNHLMKCQRNFTDETGYSVRCSANVSESLITDNSHLRCSMVSPRSRPPDKIFELPECARKPSCMVSSPEMPYPFNCSLKSIHYQKLVNASCSFNAVTHCLQPGRKIFNLHKTFGDDLACNKTDMSVPVCRLSWCADYRYIMKNVIPGELLCDGNFDEKEYTPPVTTPSTSPPPA